VTAESQGVELTSKKEGSRFVPRAKSVAPPAQRAEPVPLSVPSVPRERLHDSENRASAEPTSKFETSDRGHGHARDLRDSPEVFFASASCAKRKNAKFPLSASRDEFRSFSARATALDEAPRRKDPMKRHAPSQPPVGQRFSLSTAAVSRPKTGCGKRARSARRQSDQCSPRCRPGPPFYGGPTAPSATVPRKPVPGTAQAPACRRQNALPLENAAVRAGHHRAGPPVIRDGENSAGFQNPGEPLARRQNPGLRPPAKEPSNFA